MSQINIDKIAKALRAKRRAKVRATSGYFGALDLAAEVQARFRVPDRGGRATDPAWETKRLLPLKQRTLRELEKLARAIETKRRARVEPMQVAALLLEKTLSQVTEEEAAAIIESRQ